MKVIKGCEPNFEVKSSKLLQIARYPALNNMYIVLGKLS